MPRKTIQFKFVFEYIAFTDSSPDTGVASCGERGAYSAKRALARLSVHC